MAKICGILSAEVLDPAHGNRVQDMAKALSRTSNTEDGIEEIKNSSGELIGMVGYRHFRHFEDQQVGSRGLLKSESGDQVIAYGRIFNDDFERGNSEAKYLMNLWTKKEMRFADELNGKWSAVIFDGMDRFILSHDRFGQETIFYSIKNGLLIFGTNIRSLLASGLIEAKPNYESLWHGLGFPCAPQPYTAFEGIFALPKAQHLIWYNGNTETRTYHELKYCKKDRTLSLDEYAELIDEAMDRAVRRQIKGTWKPGSLLSGGVDSTYYTALGKCHAPTLGAVTLTLEDHAFKAADESEIAGENARMHDVPHQVVYMSPDQILGEWDAVIDNFEQPGSTFNTYYFAGKAAQQAGFANVLTGMSADELFGGFGYFRYIRMWRKYLWGAPLWKMIPKGFVKKLDSFSEMFEAREMIDFYTHNFVVMKEREKKMIWPRSGFNTYEHIRTLYTEATQPCDDIDIMIYLMTANTPHEQLYRMGQSLKDHGIFGLHPFMDNDFVDLAMRISTEYKVQGYDRKVVLKRAAQKWVSSEAVSMNKLGCSFPMGYWLEHELQDASEVLINSLLERGFMDASGVDKLRKKNEKLFPKKTYKLLFMEKWFQAFIDS
ncbi:MAG: hypothetical protein J4F31_06825 [Flavobacteriales bacterium]|nr:hypothetical protein [Flavobacteriales bacterium]